MTAFLADAGLAGLTLADGFVEAIFPAFDGALAAAFADGFEDDFTPEDAFEEPLALGWPAATSAVTAKTKDSHDPIDLRIVSLKQHS